MDKYIVDLIQKKNRVIVPEFGAFIVKQGNPKSIVFNEFLKYNDGLLVGTIKDAEKISEEQALKKVEDYVSDLNSQLNIGQQHKIEGFGILKKDASNRISFTPETGASEVKKQMPEPAQPKKETKEEPIEFVDDTPKEKVSKPIPETKKETGKETPKTSAAPEKEEKKSVQETPVTRPASTVSGIKNTTEPKKDTGSTPEPEKKDPRVINKPGRTAPPTQNTTPRPKISYSAQKKSGSKKNLVWSAMIVIILGAIIVWFIVNREYLFDGANNNEEQAAITISPETEVEQLAEPEETNNVQESTEQNESSGQSEQTQAQQPVVSNNTSTQTSSAAPQKKYYVVAGCFQFEKNADNYVSYLRDQGYGAEKFGKYGNLYAVSFESFASYAGAVDQMKKLKRSTEPNAWVLYY